jgi:hypothetical protein
MGKVKAPAVSLSGATLIRLAALGELWQHRSHWRLPVPRALMRRERDTQLSELLPGITIIAFMVGVLVFVTLPSALGGSYPTALVTLWPIWVIQAAPVAASQVLAMQRAPTLALELTQRHATGEFHALGYMQSSPAAYPCISIIVAHAWVTAAACCLLVMMTLLFGLGASFVLAVGDLRFATDAVLTLVSPWSWLRSLVTAGVLGALCSLAAILCAWPGTQSAAVAVDAHRLGLRTMVTASFAGIAGAVLVNWFVNLFSLGLKF